MAKQKPTPPRLNILIEKIKAASILAGKPVMEKDMARVLGMGKQWLSSLKKRDRDGAPLPAEASTYILKLQREYKHLLNDDEEAVKVDLEQVVSWLVKEVIRLRPEVAYVLNEQKKEKTAEEWEAAQAAMLEDAARQLDEVLKSGYFSS